MEEEHANALGLRQTRVYEGACKNCGGDIQVKWKYGKQDAACMECGFSPEETTN